MLAITDKAVVRNRGPIVYRGALKTQLMRCKSYSFADSPIHTEIGECRQGEDEI